MKATKMLVMALSVIGLLATIIVPVHADSTIWGSSASSGNVNLEAFTVNSSGVATLAQQFLVPNLTARGDNGRGVALLGNTIYYTTANSGNIYVTNSISHADLGILASTGFLGIANVATDGVFIYASDYQTSSGVVNKYNTSGALVGSVIVGSGYGRDGFEVQNNPNIAGGATTFISNRGDLTSPYDVYDSSGTLLISAFIDPALNGFGTGQTGIAYDGANYYVSQIFSNELLKYSGTGAFLGVVDLSGIPNPYTGRLLEDLSAVGNTITNPAVPEPASLLLLGSGLGMIGLAAWRKRK